MEGFRWVGAGGVGPAGGVPVAPPESLCSTVLNPQNDTHISDRKNTDTLKTLAFNFRLAIIAFRALEFIVPKYEHRLENGQEESRFLDLRSFGSSRSERKGQQRSKMKIKLLGCYMRRNKADRHKKRQRGPSLKTATIMIKKQTSFERCKFGKKKLRR